ncbi:MAG: imidazole glycerol phosphate synthase subunit HisH [Chloroflexota bacterium]
MITIIDYNAGNLTSVKRGLEHLSIENKISSDPDVVRNAEKIIFPGVGHAGSAMKVLKDKGLDKAIIEAYRKGIPILGICIGCQIILTFSEEAGTDCLNLIPGKCLKFNLGDTTLKIPHMGWNTVSVCQPHPILNGISSDEEFYFVHSYYPQPENSLNVFAECDYGGIFPAAIGKENLFAVQFHTEKSGPAGLKLLENFSKWSA